jgi:hypothetical protein
MYLLIYIKTIKNTKFDNVSVLKKEYYQIFSLDILENVAVKIPGIPRISSITLSGTSLSTFSTMMALSPGWTRPTCMPAILMLTFPRMVEARPAFR